MKRKYKRIVSDAVRIRLGGLKIKKPVILHYKFYEADKRRDKMNIFSFADKVIEDALQEVGVLQNDGWKDVVNTTHEFYVDKAKPRIEVTIEEVEGS